MFLTRKNILVCLKSSSDQRQMENSLIVYKKCLKLLFLGFEPHRACICQHLKNVLPNHLPNLSARACALVEEAGLLEQEHEWIRLSKRGRLLGNEVFLRLLPD